MVDWPAVQNRPRITFLSSLFLLGCLGLLAGCPPPQLAVRAYPPPQAEQLLAHLATARQQIQRLRGRAKADLANHEGRIKVDLWVLAEKPERLRLASENALAGPLLTVATDGGNFSMLDVRNGRFARGVVNACSMGQVLGISLHPSQLIEALFGGTPMLTQPTEFSVSWDGLAGGRDVLRMRDARGVSQQVAFQAQTPTGTAWDVVSAEAQAPDGRILWRLRHESHQPVEKGSAVVRLPGVTYLSDPSRGTEVKLRWRERELDAEIDPALFSLSAPDGLPILPDVCAEAVPAPAPVPAALPGPASP